MSCVLPSILFETEWVKTMIQNYLLSMDVGTSVCKVGIFDPGEGRCLSLVGTEYTLSFPHPGWIEIDPEKIWAAVCTCIRECLAKSGIEAVRIAGLSMSVLGEAVLPLDAKGNPLYPFIEAWDAREDSYAATLAWWREAFDPLWLFQTSGVTLTVLPSINKILWFKKERPDIYSRTWKFLCAEDYLIFKLTGSPRIDYSMASRTMAFDISAKRWSTEILATAGIEADLLAEVCPSGTVVGKVNKEASELTGLLPGTPVVAGGHDQPCAALGVGVIEEGCASAGLGSVEAVCIATQKPATTAAMMERHQASYCHVAPDRYLALGASPAYGHVVRWYRDTFAESEATQAEREGRDVYDIIMEKAASSPPGANGLFALPYFNGSGSGQVPAFNRRSRAAILGLAPNHSKADVCRALVESTTFETRAVLEGLEESGIDIQELRVMGGGARSDFWLRLKAHVIDKRIVVPRSTEGGLLGAACLAGWGVGLYSDLHQALEKVYREERVIEPVDRDLVAFYDRCYRFYRRIYPALNPLYDDLAGLINTG